MVTVPWRSLSSSCRSAGSFSAWPESAERTSTNMPASGRGVPLPTTSLRRVSGSSGRSRTATASTRRRMLAASGARYELATRAFRVPLALLLEHEVRPGDRLDLADIPFGIEEAKDGQENRALLQGAALADRPTESIRREPSA